MKTLLVLAGGFGTRLRSLVSDVPKPLAPVLGRPFIEYLIKNWINQGVSEFVFLLHYEAHKIQTILNLMSRNREFSMATFKVLIENKPLGTGGAVMNAIDLLNLKESFLVANADTWLGSGIKEIANLEPCSIGAVWSSNTERYGLIEFNQNKVSAFREKSKSSGEGYINSGLYHLKPEAFNDFVIGSNFSLEEKIFPSLVTMQKLAACQMETDFIDIGIPEEYLRFCNWMHGGKVNAL